MVGIAGLDGGHDEVGWWARWDWMVGTVGLDRGPLRA